MTKIPMFKTKDLEFRTLEFGNYLGFGICNLEFQSQSIIEKC